MMKRVQKHIDSNVTAADEVLQQSEEVVAKMVTKEPEVEQATEAKSANKADEKSKKKKRKHKKNKKSKQSFFKMLRMEWKSVSKPKPKELAVATIRTVVISVISAGVISGFDFGVTQIMVQLAKLIG
jgi:preprotein translocase subunit SecE